MIHEIYIGGPATQNLGLNMFPCVPFNPANPQFQAVTPASHKGSIQYALTRTLDTEEHALLHYINKLGKDGTPLVATDQLGIILMPKNMLYYGVYFEVERPVEGLIVTPNVRGEDLELPAIDCSVVGNGFAVLAAAPTAPAVLSWVEEGAVDLSAAFFTNNPHILDLTIDTIDADEQLGNLRLSVSPLCSRLQTGQH